jgi:hypothetical protein
MLPTQFAGAHGTPIVVRQSAGALVVTGELSDSEGFAPYYFAEDDEEGDPFTATLPNGEPAVIWQVPGFNISGLNNQSSLSIEVIARPVKGSMPLEDRALWYWDPETGCVEPTDSDFYLLGTGARSTIISPDDDPPPPFLLAATLTGQQVPHNHDLLAYALDDSPQAAEGAYGFFARLTSSQYSPSNPFLIVLNHGVAHEQMVEAALAINAAAADLEGDFNHDGAVDAADYVEWRKSIGTTAEYESWRGNFGATPCDCESGEGSGLVAAVPEASSLTLGFTAVALSLIAMHWRRVPH